MSAPGSTDFKAPMASRYHILWADMSLSRFHIMGGTGQGWSVNGVYWLDILVVNTGHPLALCCHARLAADEVSITPVRFD